MQALPLIFGGLSAYSGYRAARAQKKAIKSQQRADALAANRSRRQAFREMQIQRARSIVAAGAAGGLQSSSFAGGQASLSSQFGEASGFATQTSAINAQTSAFQQSAANWQGIGAMAGGAAELASGFNKMKSGSTGPDVNAYKVF